jgi:diguanylate cyclase (GGDEF)-like protein
MAISPKLPTTVGLAAVAAIGYFFGRFRRGQRLGSELQARKEIERAQAVAKELESIAHAIRRNLALHESSIAKFKDEVCSLKAVQDVDGWQKLCAEAEEVLRPTQRLATQLAHAYEEVRQQANHLMSFTEVRTDPLTGVRNRRALDEAIESLLAMKQRYDQPFSVVIFDIDHFKRINDELGHVAGDRVLRAVAGVLNEGIRQNDVLARYGGEEFVITMPQTGYHAAALVADRLREAMAQSSLADVRLTASGGVAEAIDGDDAPSLLGRADQALYHAKTTGRNRVYAHDGENVVPVGQPEEAVAG